MERVLKLSPKKSLFAITVPHKICEYRMECKPVVAAAREDNRHEVMTAGAGMDFEQESPRFIAATIKAIYQDAGETNRDGVHGTIICS
jgi:hypothetical protein